MVKYTKIDWLIILLIIISAPLRLINLGYSEYQDDEKKAFIRLVEGEKVLPFLVQQRKGPMQFFVSYVPYMFTHDFRNELAERLPFAILNIASILVLYFLLNRLTKNKGVSFFIALLYATNGFIVGFSRIAQYQNLNLFFSLLSLYFFSYLTDESKNIIRYSIFGTIAFCFSLLSHWDAIYFVFPILIFLIKYVFRKDISAKNKFTLVIVNIVIGCIILLPFLIPTTLFHSTNKDSNQYFSRRVGLSSYPWERHKFIFELYNPYFTLAIYILLTVLSLAFLSPNLIYFVWFVLNLITIKYFMEKPGTHIYNYILPLFFVFSISISKLINVIAKKLKILFLTLGIVIVTVLYYQSYLMFVDHTKEYPWESKKIFKYETKPYVDKEVLTFGFPHFRDWKNINEITKNFNPNCGYITNEGKEISQIYMDLKYGSLKECTYIISVTKPFISTRDGVNFPKATKIYSYQRNDETYTKVYIKGL